MNEVTEVIFEDNLVYPKEKEVIRWSGEEPFRLYYSIRNFFKDVFALAGKDIFERQLKWDASSPNKSFYCKMEFEKKIDKWTKIELAIVFQGTQNSDTRKGDIIITILPVFKTTVGIGFFQRTFWWIYYFIFYKNKRMHDFYYCKNLVNKFRIQVANLYGIPIEESI